MTRPDDVFAALAAETGVRLFTITAHDPAAGLFRRAWTSHPRDYPVSGTKPRSDDAWSAQVIDRRQSFVANSTEGFAHLFPDHALINALGCAAVLNVPVSADDGSLAGTVNLLDVAGWFTPARIARIEALVTARRPALAAAMAASMTAPGAKPAAGGA